MAEPLIITPRTVRRTAGTGDGPLTRAPFVAIDIETTGISPHTARIIEIGAVRMNHEGEVLEKFSSLANPGYDVPLNPQAQKIHGITPAMVWSAPPIADVLDELAAFVGPHGLVAHNLAFENGFLTREYERIGKCPDWQGICTLAASRGLVSAPNYKLATLIDLLELPAVNDHRATTDAHACGLLLSALITRCHASDLEPLGTPRQSPSTPTGKRRPDPTTRRPQPHFPRPTPGGIGTPAAVRDAFGGNTPTAEQSAIIDTFRRGDDMVVAALAGTGKTATLQGLARLEADSRPQRRGIYLAFNRSVADEADTSFPKPVSASTAHRLATRHLQSTPQGALLAKLHGGRAKFRDMGELINARRLTVRTPDGARTFAQYPVTRMALATVEKFCTTMDARITARHVPPQLGVDDPDSRAELAAHIVPCAQAAWAALCDPHTWTIKFTPTHALKLWADMHPKIGRDGDYLMLDEAQDANPLIASIVDDQTHMQRIRVGDSNQAIYGFTGAVDAMSAITGATTLPLTKSWRFGPAIADAGNWYLQQLGTNMRLRGNESIGSRLTLDGGAVDAVLCRTNGAALAEVISVQQAGRKAALVGDIQAATRFCESADLLKQGAPPRDADLAAFTTWADLQEYVENMPGASDLKTYVELVDAYGLDTVRAAIGNLVDSRRADLISSTAHKAKGLEFPRVRINHDWTCDPQEYTDAAALRDERMLAYVALTRAEETLDPGCLLAPPEVQKINARHGMGQTAAVGMPTPTADQLL